MPDYPALYSWCNYSNQALQHPFTDDLPVTLWGEVILLFIVAPHDVYHYMAPTSVDTL